MKTGMPTTLWPSKAKAIDDQHFSELLEMLSPLFNKILEKENISKDLLPQLREIYLPLAAWLAQKHSHTPIVIGINGAQGSGKSTLSMILKTLLEHGCGKSVAHLSIDDLYLSRQERENLADETHPLFRVRGVPGTHDVRLGKKLLSSLIQEKPELPIILPVFDKSQDDLLPESDWITINKPVDIVLFEGWCVGSIAQDPDQLSEALNTLELYDDEQGIWRNYVNEQLAGHYQSLFSFIDYLVMLKVPDIESVFEWRRLQEKKLEASCKKNGVSTSKVMSDDEVARFIMHYERITLSNLAEMPGRADILLELDKQHQICEIRVEA